MSRNGFALLGVLWTVTLLAGVVAAGTATARIGHKASANRIALARAHWAAEACLAIAESRAVRNTLPDTDTIDLGRTVACSWSVDRQDARLDLNHAPTSTIARLAINAGLSSRLADEFAAAVVDARRKVGFTSVEQVAAFPGANPAVISLLSVDGSGRVDAAGAPAAVLGSLPGITPEAVTTLRRRRAFGRSIETFDELSGALSAAARATLHAHYAELVTLLQFGSTRLLITAEGWVGGASLPRAATEIVVERLPDRLAVLRRRQR